MEIKERIGVFLSSILSNYEMRQQDLADLLGISLGRLSAYLAGKEMPRIEVLIKLSEIGGITVDDILKKDDPETKDIISVNSSNNVTVIGGVVHGDFNYNQPAKKIYYKYTYQPGDLTEEQAAKILDLVNQIVEREKLLKKHGKTHAAILGSLKKYFKVAYYRKIGEDRFQEAVTYLEKWRGRLGRSKQFPKKDEDAYLKDRYKAIHTIARNELSWSKEDVNDYIYDKFSVTSIKDLDNLQLEKLYNIMHGFKKKKRSKHTE
jgi:transcriptional regulator with XRE-family HTH domain